jgi:NAD(P)-dependent dehydrogenase (short-subunit alcohol dehydrogenase family)
LSSLAEVAELESAIATTFASHGAHVHILDLNMDAANKTAAEIKKAGFIAKGFRCNVADFNKLVK